MNDSPIFSNNRKDLIAALQKIAKEPDLIQNDRELKSLITKIYKKGRKQERKTNQNQIKSEDLQLKSQTYIFQRNDENNASLPVEGFNKTPKFLKRPARCYVCKEQYQQLHFFYHQLCTTCGDFNFQKRQINTDLSGKIALITGGRVKIGYHLVLKMLRNGATVILTTRFPNDAWTRFLKETDASDWKERLHIYGLDLRNLPALERFVQKLYATFSHLDIIINNAAQTVKRPLAFYQHLLANEHQNYLLEATENQTDIISISKYFPQGQLDKDLQQVDLREKNTWTTSLSQVTPVEMLEVQLVNNIAPFMLNSQLKSLMLQSPSERKFIINVSAMEGQFSKENKTVFHPHTNMAKAALNMMTRTSAEDYAKDGIFMNSVDTGWITDENPHPKKKAQRKKGFVTPLDIVDGAMRIYAPIVDGFENESVPIFGQFLKDYHSVDW